MIDGVDGVLIEKLPSIVPLSSVFLKDAFVLNTHGFQVFPRLMKDCVTDDLIAKCKTQCEQEGEAVFNNSKRPDGRLNDKKRLQLSVDQIKCVEMMRCKTVLTKRLTPLFPRHKVDAMVALLSLPGCKAQLEHTDLSQSTLAKVLLPEHDEQMPLACMIALTDGTLLDVWPGAIRFGTSRKFKHMQVKLRAGDVLVFRGDLVHGGAAVNDANVRIHAYLDVVDGVVRPKHKDGVEETHFMCDEEHILKRWK